MEIVNSHFLSPFFQIDYQYTAAVQQTKAQIIDTTIVNVNSYDLLIVQTISKQTIYLITNHTTKEMHQFNYKNHVKFIPIIIEGSNCVVISDHINGKQIDIHCFSMNTTKNELKLNVFEIDSIKTLPIKKIITTDENMLMFLNIADAVTVLRYDSHTKKVKRNKKVVHGAIDINAIRYKNSAKNFVAVSTNLNGKYYIEIYMYGSFILLYWKHFVLFIFTLISVFFFAFVFPD